MNTMVSMCKPDMRQRVLNRRAWRIQIIFGLLICTALPGCASTPRPFYSAHAAILVGESFPEEAQFPEGIHLTRQGNVWVAEEVREGKSRKLVEHAVVLVDANGIVKGKRYSLEREESSFLLWQFGRSHSEWECHLEPMEPISHIRPVFESLSAVCPTLGLKYEVREPFALLDAIAADSNVNNPDFAFRSVEEVNFLPTFRRTIWSARRLGEHTLQVSIEHRWDYVLPIQLPLCLIVWPFLHL